MSVLSRVMEESPARGTDRMVLTVLAYRADVAGLCFPSNKWTAKRAGISAAAAGRTIRELERAGEIVRFARVREDGGQSSNLILLARYADRAALDDHIAQGGQCAALIREYLAENTDVCPPRLDASPPPSGVTPPPVQDDAPPPSGVTGHDSILYPIGILKDSGVSVATAATGESVGPTAAPVDAWLPLKVSIATLATGKPRTMTAAGKPLGWIGTIVGDVGKIAGDDPDLALTLWDCFEEALTPDERERFINSGNVGERFGRWSKNGGASTIRAILAQGDGGEA